MLPARLCTGRVCALPIHETEQQILKANTDGAYDIAAAVS